MNIFISYKQSWIEKQELDTNLWKIREILDNQNNNNYIYYFDDDSNQSAKYILNIARKQIQKSDLIIWFINHKEKSEWQMLELWIADWNWKKIVLLINNKFKNDYFLSFWLNCDIIYFDNIDNIENLINNYLKWK